MGNPGTYLNPVYRHSCPDPFVLKHRGAYWAYCTGFEKDGRCFGVLYSPDLVQWRKLGGAMEPLPGGYTCYWAPEAIYENGRFYLYYSVGNEERMHIRAAISDHPAGPFIDSGRALTQEPFAIDAHVFTDDDGARYLFYATDSLTHHHIGTGTSMDRMLDPLTLAGQPRPVTRAHYDWQVYDLHRVEKGGVRWHTLEGPFVLKRKTLYYQMFSGGNWQNPSYGVSYAVSDRVETQEEWTQTSDGVRTFPILRSDPERGVIGPGHNSVVRGPDNRQLFCIYHRWVEDASPDLIHAEQSRASIDPQEPGKSHPARVMAIDRLEWVGDRLAVLGPTTAPQPLPLQPTLAFFRGGEGSESSAVEATPAGPPSSPGQKLPEGWATSGGRWEICNGMAVQQDTRPGELSEARLPLPVGPFVLEVSLQALSPEQRNPSAFGLLLLDAGEDVAFSVELLPRTGAAGAPGAGTATGMAATGEGEDRQEHILPLSSDFASNALHLLRLELGGKRLNLAIDGIPRWSGRIPALPAAAVLFTRNMAAGFSAFEFTAGWEDLFGESENPAGLGWEALSGKWSLLEGQLWQMDAGAQHALIFKKYAVDDFELVANLHLHDPARDDSAFGISLHPAGENRPTNTEGTRILLERRGSGKNPLRWSLAVHTPLGRQDFSLPEGLDPAACQQFRLTRQGENLIIRWEAETLGEFHLTPGPVQAGLYAHRALLSADMVRLTAI